MPPNWTGERMEGFVFNEATLEHLHRYAFAMSFAKNKIVLDIACGEGYGSNLLAGVAERVYGIDNHKPTIDRAQTKYKRPNLIFQRGKAEALPAENETMDLVVSFETIEHVEGQEKMMQEIKRVLKPGGLLLLSSPDRKIYSDETGYRNPHHRKELYKEEFRSIVQQNFLHAQFVGQAFVPGSLIFDQEYNNGFQIYSGNLDEVFPARPTPLFWIALASDAPVHAPGASLFYNAEIYAKIIEEELAVVRRTPSYRLGSFLLAPFRYLRSFFRS